MTRLTFFGDPPPSIEGTELPGRLIVLEGTDGVGRSTHIALLKEWLEAHGHAVIDTGLRRSDLAGRGIERAKRGNTLDSLTLNLFYATDFLDRLERQIIPALRAGMVALVDRYIFSLIARAAVRGVPRDWIQDVYGFALIPDKVIYLDIDIAQLQPRVVASHGFDYWESGQDYLRNPGLFDGWVTYQTALLAEFRQLADEHGFTVINARGTLAEVFNDLQHEVRQVVEGMSRQSVLPSDPSDA